MNPHHRVVSHPEGDPGEIQTAIFEAAIKCDLIGSGDSPGVSVFAEKCCPVEWGERAPPVQHLVDHNPLSILLVPAPDPDPADLIFGQATPHPFVVEPALASNRFGMDCPVGTNGRDRSGHRDKRIGVVVGPVGGTGPGKELFAFGVPDWGRLGEESEIVAFVGHPEVECKAF